MLLFDCSVAAVHRKYGRPTLPSNAPKRLVGMERPAVAHLVSKQNTKGLLRVSVSPCLGVSVVNHFP